MPLISWAHSHYWAGVPGPPEPPAVEVVHGVPIFLPGITPFITAVEIEAGAAWTVDAIEFVRAAAWTIHYALDVQARATSAIFASATATAVYGWETRASVTADLHSEMWTEWRNMETLYLLGLLRRKRDRR